MPRVSRYLTTLLVCAVSSSAMHAQGLPAYRLTGDTLRYAMDNPFRMYWIVGGDSIGEPRRARSIEAHVWHGSAERPMVEIRQVSLDLERTTKTDTFTLTAQGRVVAVNHRPPTSAQRVDLLLGLPGAPMRVGTTWTDTIRNGGTDAGGPQWYEVIRSYRVTRLVDTLGGRGVAEVSATGSIRFRFGYWVDSAANRAAWIEVEGPVTERYMFDVARGRLLRREWDMDLRGRGVPPAGSDTVAAGLRSGETLVLSDAPATRFLLARLEGPDTAVTVDMKRNAPILLHTVERQADRIRSSLARNDGTAGVAAATFAGSVITEHEATWADSAMMLATRRVVRRGEQLIYSRDGRDSTMIMPGPGPWAVADYGMQELLAPMLLGLPRDGSAHEIAVFRPYPGHWDSAKAVAQERGGVVLIVLHFAKLQEQEVFVFTHDGDLLFAESGGAASWRRIAVDTARQARLQAALPALRGGG